VIHVIHTEVVVVIVDSIVISICVKMDPLSRSIRHNQDHSRLSEMLNPLRLKSTKMDLLKLDSWSTLISLITREETFMSEGVVK